VLDHCKGARAKADAAGFTCLDRTWRGWHVHYRFRCQRGHTFTKVINGLVAAATPSCPQCQQDSRQEKLHALAQKAGVTCLETQWLGSHGMHRFTCPEGHTWQRSGRHALDHVGCPVCVTRRRISNQYHADGLERLKEMARRHGGQCLSERYEGVEHAYTFCCAAGHQWLATGMGVLANQWCRKCADIERGKKRRYADGLARLQAIAAEHGGRCLSTTYEGGQSLYNFRCRAGHVWEARGRKVLNGSWCFACVNEAKRLSLDDARQAAEARGGECLSTVYESATAKMQWLCHRGHAWSAALTTVRRGHWCPECAWLAMSTRARTRRKYEAVEAPDIPPAPRRKNHRV
jgi:hypothetical protein